MQLRKLVVGAAVMGLAMSAGIAYASIPDSNKKVHGCWKAAAATNGTHKLTVIDTATTPTCPSGFNSLNWPTKGQLLYQNFAFFVGPFTSGQTVATFTGVPAGLMCVTISASAFTTTPQSFLVLGFSSPTAPSGFGELFANEANSHKTLVLTGTRCQPVAAGNFSWTGSAFNGSTTSDGNDDGSLSVQVFAN
jgi:hypothetical protein